MKKIIILFFLSTSILFSQSIKDFTKEEKNFIKTHPIINVGTETDWAPFDFYENGEYTGISKEYLDLIEKKSGLKFSYVKDSWTNLLKKTKNKEIDLLPILAKTADRQKYLLYTNSYINIRYYIFTKESYQNINNIEDLYGKTVAIPKDYVQEDYIRKNHPKIKILPVLNILEAIDAVITNKANATISNTPLIDYTLKKYNISGIKAQTKINFDGNQMHMATRDDYPLLKSIIQKSLNKITYEEKTLANKNWQIVFEDENSNSKLTDEEIAFIKNNIVNIAYTDNWAPFSFHENNSPKGLGFDFWEYIAKENNIKYKSHLQKNFLDALSSIKNKKNDIIITTSKTKDREEYSIFSNIYFHAPIGIATSHDKDYVPNIEAIADKKIGVGKNHTAHKLLREKYPKLNFVFIENSVDGLKKLSNNDIYALVDIMPVLAHNIDKFGYSNIKISGSTDINFGLQMMIRDDYQILQSIINKTLNNMELNKKNKIYNKWSKIKYAEPFDYSILWKISLPLLLIIVIILYKNRQLVKYQKSLKETKNDLKYSLESFKAVVDLTIEGIIIIQDHNIIFTNKEMSKIFNLSKQEILRSKIEDLFETDNNIDITNIIKNTHTNTIEINGLKNNKTFPCIIKVKSIIFKNVESTILSIIDMSEIKEKETLLINQSKMASLGEMIGNIAHQWRQPLSLISTSSTGLKLQKEFGEVSDKTLFDTLDNITETTKFLSQTIDDFQDYLKQDKEKTKFNFKLNIYKVFNILQASFQSHEINIIDNVEEELILITFENELKQVILNILNNSKDALKNITSDKKYIEIKTSENISFSIIEIIDNGGGVPIDIINKVFEPYFTTKHKKQGTGLGLYMTHKIVTESMGGRIEIKNCPYIFNDFKYDNCTKVIIHIPKQ